MITSAILRWACLSTLQCVGFIGFHLIQLEKNTTLKVWVNSVVYVVSISIVVLISIYFHHLDGISGLQYSKCLQFASDVCMVYKFWEFMWSMKVLLQIEKISTPFIVLFKCKNNRVWGQQRPWDFKNKNKRLEPKKWNSNNINTYPSTEEENNKKLRFIKCQRHYNDSPKKLVRRKLIKQQMYQNRISRKT